MRVALVNPAWDYTNSIYFGCRDTHLPLELGYANAMLERRGHQTLILDGQLDELDNGGLADQVATFAPDMTVVATAPTYLFWRCAPPELRIPADFLSRLAGRGGKTVAVGPHGSVTPRPTLRKLGCDLVIRGECEEAIAELADAGGDYHGVDGAVWLAAESDDIEARGPARASSFIDHPALSWPDRWIARHRHHHHRFDRQPDGPGAEVEASRGCPYTCSFCAKLDYRDKYRRRSLQPLLEEIDGLIAQGVRYLYFIDEIFLPREELLLELVGRDIEFGIQTRIDLWKPELLELLGKAGCVSIEAGVESLTVEGRASLDKKCRMSTEELTDRLRYARRFVPFVQANLIETVTDDPGIVDRWRDEMREAGVWANDPVPLYPYPSSPDYRKLWGQPDDFAWERAHDYYLDAFKAFSDIQEEMPLPLRDLEASCPRC